MSEISEAMNEAICETIDETLADFQDPLWLKVLKVIAFPFTIAILCVTLLLSGHCSLSMQIGDKKHETVEVK